MTLYWTNKLLPEQVPALEFIDEHSGTLLLCDTGTGKTYVSLAAIERISPRLTLIIAPLTSLDITWSPKFAQLARFTICRSLDEFQRLKRNWPSSGPKGLVLLIHYQAAARVAKRLGRVEWDLVIIDEVQGLKARNSGWSRMARRLRHARRRIALTATPLDESPIDFFGIMRFVDHTVLGEDFSDFSDEFCWRGGFKGHQWIFSSKKLPVLLDRLESCVFRLTKAFMKLPPMNVHLIGTDMLGQQARLYEQMRDHGIVEIDGYKIVGPREVTKQVKLEQMTGGAVLADDRVPISVGKAKQRKLAAVLPKIKMPVVIFCKYLHEIPIINEGFDHEGYVVRTLWGAVKGDDRTELINNFQAGLVDVLICQVRTGGVSIELTRSSTLIFYSLNFSLIDFEQIIGRFHRGGQTEEVNVYVIFAKNSVDEDIIFAIKEKHSGFYKVVSHFEKGEETVAKKNGKEKSLPFGIEEAAKAAKTSPTYLRAKLRDAKVKKAGKSYAWASKAAMLSDLKKLEAA